MAIALNGSVTTKDAGAIEGGNYSYNHTVASSLSNSCLIVWTTSGGQSQTAVTYNGVSMTNFVTFTPGSSYPAKGWYLVNPSSGTNSVSVSQASTTQKSFAFTLTGVVQTSPIGATNSGEATGAGVTKTLSVTTTNANAWVIDFAGFNDVLGSHGASQVELAVSSTAGSPFTETATYKVTTTAGSYSMTETAILGGTSMVLLVAEVIPSADVGPANLKTWNGLAKASVKTVNGLALVSIKTINGLN